MRAIRKLLVLVLIACMGAMDARSESESEKWTNVKKEFGLKMIFDERNNLSIVDLKKMNIKMEIRYIPSLKSYTVEVIKGVEKEKELRKLDKLGHDLAIEYANTLLSGALQSEENEKKKNLISATLEIFGVHTDPQLLAYWEIELIKKKAELIVETAFHRFEGAGAL